MIWGLGRFPVDHRPGLSVRMTLLNSCSTLHCRWCFLRLWFIHFYHCWWLGFSHESRPENWFLTIHDSPTWSPASPTLQQIKLKAPSDSSSQRTPYKQPLFLQKALFCLAASSKGALLSPKRSRSSQTLPEDLWRRWRRQGGSGALCAGVEKHLEVFNMLSCLIFCSKRWKIHTEVLGNRFTWCLYSYQGFV